MIGTGQITLPLVRAIAAFRCQADGKHYRDDRIMLIHNPVPPWKWHWGDAGIVDGRVLPPSGDLLAALDIEPQIGDRQTLGRYAGGQFWGAVAFRWSAFPWNNYVKTTIAISEGSGPANYKSIRSSVMLTPITLGRYSLIIFPLKLLFCSLV